MKSSTLSTLLIGSLMLLASFGPAFALSSSLLAPGTNVLRINESSVYSTNWSGYAVTGSTGSVSSVSGSWIVPTLASNSGSALAAFWVGIDGYSSNTVEQTGTLIATSSAQTTYGVPAYSAWYEFYPAGMVIINNKVTPGDVIYANVTYTGTSTTRGIFGWSTFFARDPPSRLSSKFAVNITDITAGWTFTTTGTVTNAARSSAEWIAEAPSSSRGVLPLANFGTMSFGNDSTGVTGTCYATVSTVTAAIGSFSSYQEITMVTTTGATKALPSGLSVPDGTSFSVTWYSS